MRKKIFRIVFWALIVVTTLPLVLMFFKPALPDVPSKPEAAKSFDAKMLQVETGNDGAKEIRFTEAELNSKVQQSLGDMAATPQSGAVTLKGLTIHLSGNQLVGVFRVDAVGVSLYLLIGGTLASSGNQLVLSPTQVALGRMPVPISIIGPAIRNQLTSVGMQSLLALPPAVRGVRIENDELIFQIQ